MKLFKYVTIFCLILSAICFVVSCGEINNLDIGSAEDSLSDDFMNGVETKDTDIINVTNYTSFETEMANDHILTVNGVSAFQNNNGKIYLFDDDKDEPLTECVYDAVQIWQGMLLLEKNKKEYLYKTEYLGTFEHRQRYGFLFSELNEGFDDIIQISEGVYVIEANGRRFPAVVSGRRLFEDIDCSEVIYVAEGRMLAVSHDGKTGLYYAFDGDFTELYPQSADEIIYGETIYNEDRDRINLFFVKSNGAYSVYIDCDDGFSYCVSDEVYDRIDIKSDGIVTAVRDGQTYYISCYDGSESSDVPKNYRIIQTVGNYQVIRYYRALGCGVINGNDTIIPCEYGMIRAIADDRFFCSKIKGEDGVILDNNGAQIAEGFRFLYSTDAPDHKNTLYIAELTTEHGFEIVLIDKDGNEINTGYEIKDIKYGYNNTYIINGDICFKP